MKRDTLRSNELLMFFDYVSWYTNTGKVNDLVCVLEFLGSDSYLKRLYVDYPSPEGTPHDHYLTTNVMLHLFLESELIVVNKVKKFDNIFIVGDNGMMSKELVFTLSTLKSLLGLCILLIPLCSHHAYSLADSHGGKVKPVLKKVLLKNEYPVRSQDLKMLIEHHVSNTVVHILPAPDKKQLDNTHYQPIRNIRGISSYGCIEPLGIGMARARTLVGQPEPWDTSLGPLPVGKTSPGWFYHDFRGWTSGQSCRACSALEMKTVKRVGHECVFKPPPKRAAKPVRKRRRNNLSDPEESEPEGSGSDSGDDMQPPQSNNNPNAGGAESKHHPRIGVRADTNSKRVDSKIIDLVIQGKSCYLCFKSCDGKDMVCDRNRCHLSFHKRCYTKKWGAITNWQKAKCMCSQCWHCSKPLLNTIVVKGPCSHCANDMHLACAKLPAYDYYCPLCWRPYWPDDKAAKA